MSQRGVTERLRGAGLRRTPQRELILATIDELRHATPEQVHAAVAEQVASINLSTVYRTLETLEEHALVGHVHLGGRAPTYHAVEGHATHFHLTCRNCEQVIAVEADVAGELADRLRREHDFEMDLGHLSIFGTHTRCPGRDQDRGREDR